MGQKVSPTGLRIGIIRDWASRWFGGASYQKYLADDLRVRRFLEKRLRGMAVDHIDIERNTDTITVVIATARPGLVIGRGGSDVEKLKDQIRTLVKRKLAVRIEIQEIKNPEASAAVMAESIAEQIEKRLPFRRTMRMTLAKIIASRDVKGAKIQLGGRLDGAEIARLEHVESGNLPLQSLRANIDFARATAHTTFGTIGIKVWIYKGDTFE
ncbi:MAG: 30S ribosomal protein S3 [Candidatus Paceibacterota bacterium]|nr:MAG: 30S ribosomal protein S3 [Candidatus Paceibacterota bacterium]